MRTLFSLFVFCLLSNFATAQFQWGVKAGLNAVTVNQEVDSKFPAEDLLEPTLAYHAGGFTNYQFANSDAGLGIELLYSLKGTLIKANSGVGSDSKLQLHYLSLPVLLNYSVNNFKIEVGPEFGYKLAAKVKIDGETNDFASMLWDEEDFDVAADVGLAYRFNKVQLGLRYSHSLLPLQRFYFTDAIGTSVSQGNYTNRTLQLSVGYQLN